MAHKDIVTLKDGTQIDSAGMVSVCWRCRRLLPVRVMGMRRMKKGGLIAVQSNCPPCRQQ